MADKLDVIVFGATGFTGKYTVKELHRINKASTNPLTWGIAGRNEEKLKSVLKFCEEKTGDNFAHVKIIIADVSDEESLKKMCEQAKVIINCCGPYRHYGEPVVKACIASKTHHVDVSGEPQFIEKVQLDYHKAAQEAGVYVISACGFDSIPADLGVVYLQDKFEGTVNSIESYLETHAKVKSGGAVLHYGTWESAVYGLAHANELRPLRSKLYPERLPKFTPKLQNRGLIHKNQLIGDKWALPFMGSDKSVVQRSQRYFFENDKKRPIQLQPYFLVPNLLAVFVMAFFGVMFAVLTKFGFGRSLLLKYPRLFSGGFASHEGPSEEYSDNCHFTMTFVGKGWTTGNQLVEVTDQHTEPPNKTVITQVKGVNPGYGATCTMLVLSALTILKDAAKMPESGGVFPPGAAFAKTSLLENLQKNGVEFLFVSGKEE